MRGFVLPVPRARVPGSLRGHVSAWRPGHVWPGATCIPGEKRDRVPAAGGAGAGAGGRSMLIPESWGTRNRGESSGARARRPAPAETVSESMKCCKTRERAPEAAEDAQVPSGNLLLSYSKK